MVTKERAIILAKTKYGEADLILKVIASNGDVFSLIAKSALKSKKRFGGGVLEPMHFVSLTYARPRDNESERLSVLTEAQMIDDFRGLKTDYDRLALAFHMVKTVATVAREGDAQKEIFDLLGHSLKAAEVSSQMAFLKVQFDLKLLHLQGVLPPESLYLPFLRSSVREHEQIAASVIKQDSDWRLISQQVALIMQNYVG